MRHLLFILLLFLQSPLYAQITGVVVDALTEEGISYVSLRYEGLPDYAVTDTIGSFSIARRNSYRIMVSAVGYKPTYIKVNARTPDVLRIPLSPDVQEMKEVHVVGKRAKYSRKNNPAVELMRRVVDNKTRNDVIYNPSYQYENYKKVVLVANDLKEADVIKEKAEGSKSLFSNQIEYNPLINKTVLPLHIEESVTRKTRKNGALHEEMLGHNSSGVFNFSENSSEFMNKIFGDLSDDIDIYKDEIRLLQQKFVSPVSASGLSFYRYYIADTLLLGDKPCIEVYFTPSNQQDFGFNGVLYVCNDSDLHVKKAELSLPNKTDVNHISNMTIKQEYSPVNDGVWGLQTDDMYMELNVLGLVKNTAVIRSSKRTNYDMGGDVMYGSLDREKVNKETKDEAFWTQHRSIPLSKSEQSLSGFAENIHGKKGLNIVFLAMRFMVDDYVTFKNDKQELLPFELGPVKSVISSNPVDGLRLLAGGRTNSAFSRHSFFEGYVSSGVKSKKQYYSGKYTYSFEKIDKEPWEFPMNQISVSSEYDIISPAQKFQEADKNSVFTSMTVKPLKNFYWYNRQTIEYNKEISNKLSYKIGAKHETITPALLEGEDEGFSFRTMDGEVVDKIRTTELMLSLRYALGEKYIITKSGRYPINKDVTILKLAHSFAIPNLWGGKASNMTELSALHRLWLKSFGYADLFLRGSVQWNKVPFPLLVMPKTNLSWMAQHDSHTFMLMDDMEFLTDRELTWDVAWSPNGKIFNRIPLLKKLKLREYIAFRGMLGKLTDKNNPFVNTNDRTLLEFPSTTQVIGRKPYMEFVFGISNILKFLEVDYVRRLSYIENGKSKNGVRFAMHFSF